jgi:hypothetical protein
VKVTPPVSQSHSLDQATRSAAAAGCRPVSICLPSQHRCPARLRRDQPHCAGAARDRCQHDRHRVRVAYARRPLRWDTPAHTGRPVPATNRTADRGRPTGTCRAADRRDGSDVSRLLDRATSIRRACHRARPRRSAEGHRLGHGPGLAGRPRYCGRPVPRAARRASTAEPSPTPATRPGRTR